MDPYLDATLKYVFLAVSVIGFILCVRQHRLLIEEKAQLKHDTEAWEAWKAEFLDTHVSREEALSTAAKWLKDEEKRIRFDAVRRSDAARKGRSSEALAPMLEDFGFDPRDCRFLGSPVDYVVFDGMSAGLLRQVVFVEIKSGKYARLSKREREVQEIIELKGAVYEVRKVNWSSKG